MMKRGSRIRCRSRSAGLALLLTLLLALLLPGCAGTPIGVKKVPPRTSYEYTTANPLSPGTPSNSAKAVLNRYDLLNTFQNDPEAAIASLHATALHDDRRDILYALAETSYLYGDKLMNGDSLDHDEAPGYFLLAAIYSYVFILDERAEPPPTAYDQRFRNACEIYNYSLWRGFATGLNDALVLAGGTRPLPIGKITITLDKTQFPWDPADFEQFLPADNYEIRGLAIRNRTPGVGMPIVAMKKPTKDTPFGSQSVPVTAFLRYRGTLADLGAGTAAASLELYSAYDNTDVVVNNRRVPLQTDSTTPLAYKLEGSSMWGFGMKAFRGKLFGTIPNGLYLMQPYQPGRIPVVFVHGTASSPVWWAEMFNTLRADPELQRKYQFWYFVYSSSAPIVMSAADLRDALSAKVAALDPEGKDPGLQQMVVIGHSQGGLLTKLSVVDTGDDLLRTMTGRGLDELDMSAENKAKVARLVVIKPLPFVKKVVFIATPHRGSYRSKRWVRRIVRYLVDLPATIVSTSESYYGYLTDDTKRLMGKSKIATSADGMSPDNPLLEALAATPLAPGVEGHSIIAVLPDMQIPNGNDGVVAYKSAHIEGMESEFIVRSEHSCQGKPQTIEEVRRILLGEATPSASPPSP
jgi:pimeloyl-ACP methyl ester carboxylesterase